MGHKKLKFIGCEILYREACHLAATVAHRVDVEFLHKGLHDLETPDMLAKIQEAVDAAGSDRGYDAILLGYARCNDGVVGLTARDVPLVLPRAHDCITLFFGGRGVYQDYFERHPGTYYMTTGWCERNLDGQDERTRPAYDKTGVMAHLGLTDSYEEMVAKFGKDNADFVVESMGGWMSRYDRMLYLKMGVCDETPFIERARKEANERGWKLEVQEGDLSLLEKLFGGVWDDDFIVIPPGASIAARNDERIVDVAE